MSELERIVAAEDIRNLKATYCRAVDKKDRSLLQTVIAPDAIADYSDAMIDPVTGRGIDQNEIGAGSVVGPLRGAENIARSIVASVQDMVTVHHCAVGDIHIDGSDSAHANWPMVDRLLFRPGVSPKEIIGYGFYHETYVRDGGIWMIATLGLSRTRLDSSREAS